MIKLNKIFLLVFGIINSLYSQSNQIDCNIVETNFQYYQLTILKFDSQPTFINLVGENIDFNKIPNDNFQTFIDNVLIKSSFVPISMDRSYYFKNCENKITTEKEDLIFTAKFNNIFKKLSKKSKTSLDLKTGEKITIEKIGIDGSFLKIDIDKLKYEKSSIYPEGIYNSKSIKNYYVLYKVKKYIKLKCLK
jgi:hypothetical protein